MEGKRSGRREEVSRFIKECRLSPHQSSSQELVELHQRNCCQYTIHASAREGRETKEKKLTLREMTIEVRANTIVHSL